MSTHGTPSTTPAGTTGADRTLSLVAGVLGLLMFAWGFLHWLNIGNAQGHEKYAGYAFEMPTTAVIGFSVAAGLTAALGVLDRRPGAGIPTALPTALAGTSLLLAVGILFGKNSIAPAFGGTVGIEIGLILGVVTAALQTVVLAVILTTRAEPEAAGDVDEHSDADVV